jgi:hypothetical protein
MSSPLPPADREVDRLRVAYTAAPKHHIENDLLALHYRCGAAQGAGRPQHMRRGWLQYKFMWQGGCRLGGCGNAASGLTVPRCAAAVACLAAWHTGACPSHMTTQDACRVNV